MHSPSPTLNEHLNTILSQHTLPYTEDVTHVIRQHLISLTQTHPSLYPTTALFTHTDGRHVTLLHSDGTIPITFHDVTYHTPVVIWLTESYPRHPPLVYVNPTPDMVIKQKHPFVDHGSGLVSVPYLVNWVYPDSNLVGLGNSLSECFSKDPPLYTKKTKPNPSLTNLNVNVNASDFKRNAIKKVVENVHCDWEGREVEMEGVLGVHTVLRGREDELSIGLREIEGEREDLERKLQTLLMNILVLEQWVSENEGKLDRESLDLNVDDAFVLCDSLSKQVLDCTASDLAVEDAVSALDKSVQDGCVAFDVYLKNVRLLSREQFFHRAAAGKVRELQM